MSKAATGIGTILGFALGGATGFLACRSFFEKKYQKIADNEIESVKSAFKKDHKPVEKKDTPKGPPKEGIDKFTNYRDVLKYKTATPDLPKEEKPVISAKEPYVITPDQFGEEDDYEQISLTYYRGDSVVADDDSHAMAADEVRATIGMECLNRFGEYEADSVFVRNDERETDYEILLDYGSYADAKKQHPYL